MKQPALLLAMAAFCAAYNPYPGNPSGPSKLLITVQLSSMLNNSLYE
jgi:hypothetical protein